MEAEDPKADLRPRLRALRASESRRIADAAARAAAWLPDTLLRKAAVVAGYHPIGFELDPGPTLRRFAQAGARIVLPAGLALDAPLVFREHYAGEVLAPDVFGVASPTADAARLTPDLVIAPVLAFDRRGGRLGQGAGAYDRTLRRLRSEGGAFVIGLAFAAQELAKCPMAENDERLDAILTESGYIEVKEET